MATTPQEWAQMSVRDRCERVERFTDELVKRKEQIVNVLMVSAPC